MSRPPLLLIVVSLLLFSASRFTFAEEDPFQKGLAAYQKQNYTEARDVFEKISSEGKVTARLLHNLALTYFQLNDKPHALALWRKALAIDPSYRAARMGRDLLEQRFHMQRWEQNGFSAAFHQTLETVSIYEAVAVSALVFAIFGWLWIGYFARRRSALDEERPMPGVPFVALVFSLVLLANLTLIVFKVQDHYTVRATLLTDKVSARSLPAEDAVSLFDLPAGNEVLVHQQSSGWTQVQNRDGNTGWVKDSEILITSER